MSDPNYTAEPSYDVLDALRLVPLFYTVHWTSEKKAEWMRITGTTEATTKVMCDHIRSAIECAQKVRAATIEKCKVTISDVFASTSPRDYMMNGSGGILKRMIDALHALKEQK